MIDLWAVAKFNVYYLKKETIAIMKSNVKLNNSV